MKLPPEMKSAARGMYLRGYSVKDIARHCGKTARTIYNWIEANGWENLKADLTASQILASRIDVLANREQKSRDEIFELTQLARTVGEFDISAAKAEKIRAEAAVILAKASRVEAGETSAGSGKKGSKSSPKKNDISDLNIDFFDEFALKHFFTYQLIWREHKLERNRFILKPRQIGATYYFAFEAFEDAVKNGQNQIFLSASKAQAKVFKAYIIAFALEHFGLELKGADEIALYKDGKLHATLYFLSTNAASAQSYHGNLYIDEVFWIPNYIKLERVAKPMASQKQYRRTYFSTPSSIQHAAYKQWTGERYNKNRKLKHDFKNDLDPSTLLNGIRGPDRLWRYSLNIYDAEKMGCNLFNIEELRDENTKEDFDNLFMCKFIDDRHSVFPFSEMQACLGDESTWVHVQRDSDRPLGNKPVAIGYDPSRLRDNAALVVLEMPLKPYQKWRLIEKEQYRGASSEYQGNRIKTFDKRYNVQHIGIDITGIGYGVYEQIENMPTVMPIYYGIQVKTQLVMTGKKIIQAKRFEYDTKHTDVTQSFMQITQNTTGAGVITYGASRNAETGHADIAWSCLHGMYIEHYQQPSDTGDSGGFVMASS